MDHSNSTGMYCRIYLTINTHPHRCFTVSEGGLFFFLKDGNASETGSISQIGSTVNQIPLCLGYVVTYVPLKMYEYSCAKMTKESQSSPTQLLWQLKESR